MKDSWVSTTFECQERYVIGEPFSFEYHYQGAMDRLPDSYKVVITSLEASPLQQCPCASCLPLPYLCLAFLSVFLGYAMFRTIAKGIEGSRAPAKTCRFSAHRHAYGHLGARYTTVHNGKWLSIWSLGCCVWALGWACMADGGVFCSAFFI